MNLVKLKLNDEHFSYLKKEADDLCITIQEYIKIKTIPGYILNPIEAVKRAMEPDFQAKYKGKEFELPDLYSDEEWPGDDRGIAGAFGKTFFNYVNNNKPKNIRYVRGGSDGKRAVYTLI